MNPDLVLINPGNAAQTYQGLGDKLTAIEPPVWAGLMATFVRNHGYEVALVDANALRLTPSQVAALVTDIKPMLTAIVVYGHQPSASTQNMPAAGALAAALKAADARAPVLMLGGHVSSLPERTLESEAIDYVADGEGLWTLLDLLAKLRAGGTSPVTDFDRVRGLVRFVDGSFRHGPEAPLVQDLDVLMPTLPWDDLPMRAYRAHNWHCFGGLNRQPYAAIYTTLGCPFKCSFCCIQAPFKSGERAAGMAQTRNSYRYWSPLQVGLTLERLQRRHGVRNVKFADEMFVLNRKHVEAICDEIIARDLDLNIWAYARVDTVKDGMLPKLKKAGFNWLAFGIESGNAAIRDGVDKGFGHDEMIRTLEQARAEGINVGANYIFGLPDDNHETMQQTLDLAVAVNAEYANFYSAMAYPGSPLYEQALREHWDLPTSWSGYSQHSTNSHPLPTKHLTSAEIVAFRDQAFRIYFNNQRYRDMMLGRFGPSALTEIDEMMAVRLERH